MRKNTQTICPVITIDGPSGTGKGTVCQKLASILQWHILDSGALYRALGFAAFQHKVSFSDETALEVLARHLDVQFRSQALEAEETCCERTRVILEGTDITDKIRGEECGLWASKISAFPKVRDALLERQRAFREAPGLVTDGRDMGTVIFPDAILKIYLDASIEERASRRYLQLRSKGIVVNQQELCHELEARDRRDKERTIAPLKPADDAVLMDTTNLGIDQVMTMVLELTRKRLGQTECQIS